MEHHGGRRAVGVFKEVPPITSKGVASREKASMEKDVPVKKASAGGKGSRGQS